MTTPSEPLPAPAGGAREPAWRAAVAAWLAVHALYAALPDRAAAGLDPSSFADRPDLSPRALRGWPGIGEARALAIARARWEHPDDGPPLYLSDVEGIGAASERAVRAWLDPPEAARAGRPAGARGGAPQWAP